MLTVQAWQCAMGCVAVRATIACFLFSFDSSFIRLFVFFACLSIYVVV
jgi:hypothetical protein